MRAHPNTSAVLRVRLLTEIFGFDSVIFCAAKADKFALESSHGADQAQQKRQGESQ
jgi:hypothetical protein